MITYEDTLQCKRFAISYRLATIVSHRLGYDLNEARDITGKVEDGLFANIIWKHSTAAVVSDNKVQYLIDIIYEKADIIGYEKEILDYSTYKLDNGVIVWFTVMGDYLATIQIKEIDGTSHIAEGNLVPFEDAKKMAYDGYMRAMQKQ